jgi:hypothetical protein
MAKKKTNIELLRMHPPTAAEWREGTALALAVIRDFEAASVEDLNCEADCRDGLPQQNIFRSHLLRLIAVDDQGVWTAFSSVLTHVLGNALPRECGKAAESFAAAASKMMRKPIPMIWRPGDYELITTKWFGDAHHG